MPRSTAAKEIDDADLSLGLVPAWLSNLLGFQLRMAQAALHRDYAAATASLNLTQRQLAVLEIVSATPGVAQVDIATQLSIDRATMMSIIDRLEQRGLVERSRSHEDRRRQKLNLTKAGEASLAESRRIVAEHDKQFTDRFTPDELTALFDALRRIQD